MSTLQVIDASVLVDVLADGSQPVRRLLERPVFCTPPHTPLEVINGLRGLWLAGTLSAEALVEATALLPRLPVATMPIDAMIGRICELRHNLTAYDASYVALAEALGARLVTRDVRLAAAPGTRCEIVVVG